MLVKFTITGQYETQPSYYAKDASREDMAKIEKDNLEMDPCILSDADNVEVKVIIED